MMPPSDEVVLAVDYGLARVGLAFARGGFVSTLPLILTKEDPLVGILSVCEEEGVQTILVGLPEEPQRTVVQKFIQSLKEKFSGQVLTWDETLTTQVAEGRLDNSSMNHRRHPVDSEAAALMLKEYLEQ